MAALSVRSRGIPAALRVWAPVAVLAALCLLISFFSPNFLTIPNLLRLLNTAAIPMVLAMGMTFIILMGSIDLSLEGTLALAAVLVSLLVTNDVSTMNFGLWAVPLAILLGGAIGFANGFLHIRLGTPSFMTSLGIGFTAVGIATAILQGVTVRISDQAFRWLSLGRLGTVPMAVWIAILAIGIAWVIQERTRLGRWIIAIGTDETTARQVGIPIERTRIMAFVIAGLFYGLGGVLSAAQFGQGNALIGQGRLFTTTIRTPTTVFSTEPAPPDKAVPPTTTAVIVVNSRPCPMSALPWPNCAADSTPPRP